VTLMRTWLATRTFPWFPSRAPASRTGTSASGVSADNVEQITWIVQHPFEVRGGRLYGRLPILDGRVRATPDRIRKIIDQVFAGLLPHASPPREFRDGVAIVYEIEGVVDGMTVGVWGVLKDDYRDSQLASSWRPWRRSRLGRDRPRGPARNLVPVQTQSGVAIDAMPAGRSVTCRR
jgi:hypothetical protein